MPPACPVDFHDGCYPGQRLFYKFGMPPACPVDFHDGCYPGQRLFYKFGMHRLARWSFTLAVKMFLQPILRTNFTSPIAKGVLAWRTHQSEAVITLGRLDKTSLSALVSEYDIHVLECGRRCTEFC